MKIRNTYTCPLELVHDILKGKWKTIIIYFLNEGPLSLAELQRRIEGISQKMLLEQLHELEAFTLVGKTTFKGYPLHVEYFLTPKMGKRAYEAVLLFQQIGVEYMLTHGMQEQLRLKGVPVEEMLETLKAEQE